jgi:uncharacterized membrane protein YphA (DoxX/SURF4 family)
MYAAAVAGLGVLLLTAQMVYVWAPIPKWVPGRTVLAGVFGAVMVVVAMGLLWRKTVVPSSAAAASLFASWLLLLQLPRLAGAPSREVLWSGAAQLVSVTAGGWVLFASRTTATEGRWRWSRGDRGLPTARGLYALALPMFGLHHFFDLPGAAEAVPAWLPFPLAWGCLTGVGHVAAGLALLFGVVPRVAARLEASMISAFILLIHVPGVIGAPRDGLQWTELVVASVIGGAAWIAARSYASLRTDPG